MCDLSMSEIIKKYPIGTGLDAFRRDFNSVCEKLGVHESSNTTQNLNDKALKNLAFKLFPALQNLSVAQHLPSPNRCGTLFGDLGRFASEIDSDDFNVRSIIPILDEIDKNASNEAILNAVYDLITESTPSPRQLPYLSISFSTGSFVNTSENRKYYDSALRDELNSSLYIDVPDFFDIFFHDIATLSSVADSIFRKCQEGKDPLYDEEGGGWRDWPKDAKEE